MPWDHLGEQTLLRYKVFEVLRCVRRSPRTGVEIGMFTIRTWDWVHVLAFTADGQLILVRQYRHGPGSLSVELPGGAVSPGEDPATAAARELREETGFAAGAMLSLGWTSPNPAIFGNRCYTFLAIDCERQGDPTLDDGEDIEVLAATLNEVDAMILRGEIHNALVLAGLELYRVHRAGADARTGI